jgi:glycosyltransferase involved in cell wall biosynthesis
LRESLGLEEKYVILGPASKWLDPINAEVLQYFEANMESNMVLLLFGVAGDIGIDLPENVILYGYTTNREELAALYTMTDVFVNPSREESMGLINIEAQACGTPVVAFEGTGVSETVSHNHLVETGDYSSLFHTCLSVGKDHSPVLYSHLDQCSAYVALYENELDRIN